MRPLPATATCFGSISSFDLRPICPGRSAARCSRANRLGEGGAAFSQLGELGAPLRDDLFSSCGTADRT